MDTENKRKNKEVLRLNIESDKEDIQLENFINDDDYCDDEIYMNDNVCKLEIIQRKTSKSLLRAKYKRDKIQIILFFMGFFGFSIISWGLSWIIGKTCKKPKSHRGKKLRQLNGILTLIFILVPAIFSYFYYHSLSKFNLNFI